MSNIQPENKIITYLLLTALMVITFFCALAINANTFANLAWLILLTMNLGLLVYILRQKK